MLQALGAERPSRWNGGAGNGAAQLHTGRAFFVFLRGAFLATVRGCRSGLRHRGMRRTGTADHRQRR